jgi:hypothetical protein
VRAHKLLIATAIIEIGVGIPLLVTPSLVAQLLLGTPLSSPAALLVARIAGAALLAIGVSCWLERRAPIVPVTGLVSGLLVYNAAVFALLLYATLADGLSGMGIWPACALHAAMAVWCVRVIRAGRRARQQTTDRRA